MNERRRGLRVGFCPFSLLRSSFMGHPILSAFLSLILAGVGVYPRVYSVLCTRTVVVTATLRRNEDAQLNVYHFGAHPPRGTGTTVGIWAASLSPFPLSVPFWFSTGDPCRTDGGCTKRKKKKTKRQKENVESSSSINMHIFWYIISLPFAWWTTK